MSPINVFLLKKTMLSMNSGGMWTFECPFPLFIQHSTSSSSHENLMFMRCEGVCKRANLSICQGTFESRRSRERGAVEKMSHSISSGKAGKAGISVADSRKKKYD